MRAIRFDQFGPASVFRAGEMPEPAAAEPQLVVDIEARSINLIDIKVRSGAMGPLVNKKFPKVPGADFAGTIVAAGSKAGDFRIGDRVFGATDPFKGGAFAERVAVPASQVARWPSTLTAQDAAALPIAGLAALQSLRDLGHVEPGQSVLIHGATGPVGLFAIQLAKIMGAHVTAVAGAGLDTARQLGADVLIDYRKPNGLSADRRYDVILNASGKLPFADGRHYLGAAGRLIEPSPTIPVFIGSKIANLFRRRKHQVLAAQVRSDDLAYLAGLAGEGLLKPVIAAVYPFSESLPALARVEQGGVIGKIVVTR